MRKPSDAPPSFVIGETCWCIDRQWQCTEPATWTVIVFRIESSPCVQRDLVVRQVRSSVPIVGRAHVRAPGAGALAIATHGRSAYAHGPSAADHGPHASLHIEGRGRCADPRRVVGKHAAERTKSWYGEACGGSSTAREGWLRSLIHPHSMSPVGI
jgi:hypothetical protein